MTFDEYQAEARKTAIYPKEIGLAYVALGLAGEAGEVANKVKKVYRDSNGKLTGADIPKILEEGSDVLWYLAMLCDELGISMQVMIDVNIAKLAARQENDTLHGSGDNR